MATLVEEAVCQLHRDVVSKAVLHGSCHLPKVNVKLEEIAGPGISSTPDLNSPRVWFSWKLKLLGKRKTSILWMCFSWNVCMSFFICTVLLQCERSVWTYLVIIKYVFQASCLNPLPSPDSFLHPLPSPGISDLLYPIHLWFVMISQT